MTTPATTMTMTASMVPMNKTMAVAALTTLAVLTFAAGFEVPVAVVSVSSWRSRDVSLQQRLPLPLSLPLPSPQQQQQQPPQQRGRHRHHYHRCSKFSKPPPSTTVLSSYPDAVFDGSSMGGDDGGDDDGTYGTPPNDGTTTPSWRHALLSDIDLTAIENIAEYCLDIDEAMDGMVASEAAASEAAAAGGGSQGGVSVDMDKLPYTAAECDVEQHQALIEKLLEQKRLLERYQKQKQKQEQGHDVSSSSSSSSSSSFDTSPPLPPLRSDVDGHLEYIDDVLKRLQGHVA